MELVPLCNVDVVLEAPIDVGVGPAGWRLIFEVASAEMKGDRLSGTMRGRATADWLTLVETTGALDVRATFETYDGAVIFAQYRGRTDITGGPGSAPIYVAPLFETGDARYTWLNTIQAVGKGILNGLNLSYEWYELR